MSVSWPFVYASVLTAGLLGSSGIAGAEELGPEQACAFVVGKLFAFYLLRRHDRDGPHPFRQLGGRRHQNTRPGRNAVCQAPGRHGQDRRAIHVRASGGFAVHALCPRGKNRLPQLRGSLAGLSFAYCDFYQRNPRSHLVR
jgi:hypothetical protein